MLWKEIGEACGWKRPRALSVRYMFADEGDPDLPRDTKVGYVARTAPPEEEGEELEFAMERGGRTGAALDRLLPLVSCKYFFCHFLCFYLF